MAKEAYFSVLGHTDSFALGVNCIDNETGCKRVTKMKTALRKLRFEMSSGKV